MAFCDWSKFIEATKDRKPVDFLVEVIEKKKIKRGFALDLGCGAGVDAKYLAENKFEVEAVDSDKEAIKQTRKISEGLSVKVIQSNIVDYKIKKNYYSIIIAWNSLSFLDKEKANKVLENVKKGLKREGFFIFSVFGTEDDWAKNYPKMSFWTINELKENLKGMNVIKITEKKKNEAGATGVVKFWHIIKGFAQKIS